MFIGHLAFAEALQATFPTVPKVVSLVGVGFPDLLWGGLVLLGVEKVRLGKSPMQSEIDFDHYPYSHSLVLTNLIAIIPAIGFGLLYGADASIVFLLASISHWLLDLIVHKPDLPLLGFGHDRKLGFGLWRHGPLSFFVEYALVAVCTLIFIVPPKWAPVLVAAMLFHLVNLNNFFGLTRKNPISSAKGYGLMTLVGFAAIAMVFNGLL